MIMLDLRSFAIPRRKRPRVSRLISISPGFGSKVTVVYGGQRCFRWRIQIQTPTSMLYSMSHSANNDDVYFNLYCFFFLFYYKQFLSHYNQFPRQNIFVHSKKKTLKPKLLLLKIKLQLQLFMGKPLSKLTSKETRRRGLV